MKPIPKSRFTTPEWRFQDQINILAKQLAEENGLVILGHSMVGDEGGEHAFTWRTDRKSNHEQETPVCEHPV